MFNIVHKCDKSFIVFFPHQESNVLNVVMQQLYYLLLKAVINMNHTYHAKNSVLCKSICEWLNSYLSKCLLMAYLNILSAYQFPKAPVLQHFALIPLVRTKIISNTTCQKMRNTSTLNLAEEKKNLIKNENYKEIT